MTITRVDLEKTPTGVLVKNWHDKWNENACPSGSDFVPGARIETILFSLEKQGFTVEMANSNLGRALRGEITRIDFYADKGTTWVIKKYPYGWTAKTRPVKVKTVKFLEAEQAIQWCKDNGWTIREWPGGARAWKYGLAPVRDRATIRAYRRKVQDPKNAGDNMRFFDLAYDG